jgi:hypothetical protein
VNDKRWERYGAASGFAMVVISAAAMVFERTPQTAADFAAGRPALVTQSMLFVAGSAATLWFLGSLRSYLMRFEGGTARLTTVAFGAGMVWTALNITAQAFQIGAANDLRGEAPTSLLKTMNAMFTIANLPLAVMLAAVAVVSLRHRAMPTWLGWLAGAAATAQAVLWLSTAVASGPLASNGWLSFALYPIFVIWLVPATVVMIQRAGEPPTRVTAESQKPAATSREAAGI